MSWKQALPAEPALDNNKDITDDQLPKDNQQLENTLPTDPGNVLGSPNESPAIIEPETTSQFNTGLEDDDKEFLSDNSDEDNTAPFTQDNAENSFDGDNGGLLFEQPEEQPNSTRVYNDCDCAKAEQDCEDSWKLIREYDITQISLDITPSFNPNEQDKAVGLKERTRRLAQSKIRTWKDHNGEVIAVGKFQDFRNGRVFIDNETESSLEILFSSLGSDDACFVAAWWGMPTECRLTREPVEDREWVPLTMTWKASGLCHKPLYFEQIQVERYGHSFGPVAQPLISAAHFFGNALILPYQMGISPPNECEYALGYYRPGSCAPYLLSPLPLSVRGALLQSGTAVGLAFAVP